MKKILLISIFMSSMTSFHAKGMHLAEDVVPYLQAWYIPVMPGAAMHIDAGGRHLVVKTFKPEETQRYYTVTLALALTNIRRGYTKLNLEIPEDMKAELRVPTTVKLDITGDTSNVVWRTE